MSVGHLGETGQERDTKHYADSMSHVGSVGHCTDSMSHVGNTKHCTKSMSQVNNATDCGGVTQSMIPTP